MRITTANCGEETYWVLVLALDKINSGHICTQINWKLIIEKWERGWVSAPFPEKGILDFIAHGSVN